MPKAKTDLLPYKDVDMMRLFYAIESMSVFVLYLTSQTGTLNFALFSVFLKY